jgi:hypothetical protein
MYVGVSAPTDCIVQKKDPTLLSHCRTILGIPLCSLAPGSQDSGRPHRRMSGCFLGHRQNSWHSLESFLSLLLGAFLMNALAVLNASASTIRLDFTGVVTSYQDLATGASVPTMVGTTFQGYMTYNVSNPEYYSSGPIGNGQSNYLGYSDSGCMVLEINGVCTSNGGTDTPIVLDYRVRLSGQTYSPLVVDSLYADISSRENVNDVRGVVGEAWAASRQQYQVPEKARLKTVFALASLWAK